MKGTIAVPSTRTASRSHRCSPLLLAFAAPSCFAQESSRADTSAYTLFNPTPRGEMRELSTDRPDTTESPYTLDAGHVQIELSFVDFTYDSHNHDDVSTRTWAVAPMLLKLGLLNHVDVQLGIDPWIHERRTDRATDRTETSSAFGDTLLRLKINLWGNDSGESALAIMPFVKFPTAADGLGNGNIETGVIIPLTFQLPGEFTLGLMGELDFTRPGEGAGTIVDFVHTITISRSLAGDLAGFVEYAGFESLNSDEEYRAFFDAGLTYALSADVQLDAGVRVGLTTAADDLGLFVGMSLRY